jgi:hypothetical protein
MDPIEQMRQQVCEELQGSVTIVGKILRIVIDRQLSTLTVPVYYASIL